MPVSKGRHLVMFDRRMIEDMLRDGESVGAIAGKIGVSWATVAREIKRHRTPPTTRTWTARTSASSATAAG